MKTLTTAALNSEIVENSESAHKILCVVSIDCRDAGVFGSLIVPQADLAMLVERSPRYVDIRTLRAA
jgi:hypothetical protein